MYEQYYNLIEPPFSLTPDPKYFYRSDSHHRAFELLRYAIHRREGFMVVYGEIGTGKTTLCRAVLDTIEKNVYPALLLNPFLTEVDLLKAILQAGISCGNVGVVEPRQAPIRTSNRVTVGRPSETERAERVRVQPDGPCVA